jgi:hypothetical protein
MELVCKHSACNFASSILIENRLDISSGQIYPVEVWQLRVRASWASGNTRALEKKMN